MCLEFFMALISKVLFSKSIYEDLRNEVKHLKKVSFVHIEKMDVATCTIDCNIYIVLHVTFYHLVRA